MQISLGPRGPFPSVALHDALDRRWLHYAFRSPDGRLSVIANLSVLGSTDPFTKRPQEMSILLVHDEFGWESSQFNAAVEGEPWSAFRHPAPGTRLRIDGRRGSPSVDLRVVRTGHPCTSQCAPFGDGEHLRWQSEPGVLATGTVVVGGRRHEGVDLVGYHERVRGHWSWPALGGWVFGFANAATSQSGKTGKTGKIGETRDGTSDTTGPEYAVVFTLIQPLAPADAATGSVMLWRRGRLLRHFPRRTLRVEVAGHLSRDEVSVCPPLAATLGTAPTAVVPGRLVITARTADDSLVLDVTSATAGRIVNPNELGRTGFSVHEVLGPCTVRGTVAGRAVDFTAPAVVEFAGGADVD